MSPRRRRHWLAVIGALGALTAAIVSTAPAGALASWSIVPSPNNGTGINVLDGVSCPPAGSCTAVGYSSDTSLGADQTLIESGNGASWSIVPSPNNGTGDNDFLGVSCVSTSSCKAVGFSTNAIGVDRTLIESWNGVSWSIDGSPNNGTAYNVLDGVSCRRATSCTAVGYAYDTSLGATQTLIESWNGTSWSVVPSPNNGTTENILYGLACYEATSCAAVGYYATSLGAFQTLVESWNGTRWSIVPSPNEGTSDNDLLGVSCGAAGSCQAVGLYFNTSLDAYQTLTEGWNGSRWSVVPSPNNGAAYNVLAAVSCRPSARSCKAVGNYFNASLSTYQSLIESND